MNERIVLDIDDLFRCYYPMVVRLALAILCTADEATAEAAAEDEAEDAAQETFIAAAQGLNDYHGSAAPKTWLFAIAINNCRSRLRRRKTRRALHQAVMVVQRLVGGTEPPEQRVETSDRDRQLWAAVDALDEKHRLVVILRYVQELSAAEIAEVLGIGEGTVHSRLHYARQQLAGLLRRSAAFEEMEEVL